MFSVEPLEYLLTLSTGEDVLISEMDPEVVPLLREPAVLAASAPVLSRCTYAPREVLEYAKAGGTRDLEALLGTPPSGCLTKLSTPACSELRSCPMADPDRCTTLRRTKKGGPDFPMCWSYQVDPGLSEEVMYMSKALASAVVTAWRDGRYVIIVRG